MRLRRETITRLKQEGIEAEEAGAEGEPCSNERASELTFAVTDVAAVAVLCQSSAEERARKGGEVR